MENEMEELRKLMKQGIQDVKKDIYSTLNNGNNNAEPINKKQNVPEQNAIWSRLNNLTDGVMSPMQEYIFGEESVVKSQLDMRNLWEIFIFEQSKNEFANASQKTLETCTIYVNAIEKAKGDYLKMNVDKIKEQEIELELKNNALIDMKKQMEEMQNMIKNMQEKQNIKATNPKIIEIMET